MTISSSTPIRFKLENIEIGKISPVVDGEYVPPKR
jgi:hypothetical protein